MQTPTLIFGGGVVHCNFHCSVSHRWLSFDKTVLLALSPQPFPPTRMHKGPKQHATRAQQTPADGLLMLDGRTLA